VLGINLAVGHELFLDSGRHVPWHAS